MDYNKNLNPDLELKDQEVSKLKEKHYPQSTLNMLAWIQGKKEFPYSVKNIK